MNLTLKKSELLAALQCAATKDIRYYLNGVNVAFTPTAEGAKITLIGTDGHILFCGVTEANLPDGEMPEAFSMIIPRDTVKVACKGARPDTVSLVCAGGGAYSLGNMLFTPIDGKFHDFTRVIPAKCDGETAQFNPELLVRGYDALRLWAGTDRLYPRLHHNGNSAAVMTVQGAVVVVMPMRSDGEEDFAGFSLPVAIEQRKAA